MSRITSVCHRDIKKPANSLHCPIAELAKPALLLRSGPSVLLQTSSHRDAAVFQGDTFYFKNVVPNT